MSLYEEALKAERRLNFQFPYSVKDWVDNMGMFVENYHKHTTWSNIVQPDSATSIEEFIDYSKQMGCKCYFSGEHGTPGEWLHCYNVAKAKGVKFRYSVEAYWVKDKDEEFVDVSTNKLGEEVTKTHKDNANCHIVLVAKTYQAMRKINYIISEAHDNGFYYKPRIDLNLLFTLSPEDVYVTSACIAGWKYEDAAEIWLSIANHFKGSFFLEYQTHDTPEQKNLNKLIYRMSQMYGIPTIIGLDTHYISEQDRIKRDNLLRRKGIRYDDEQGWYMEFPSGEEIVRRMEEQNVLPIGETLFAMMNTHIFISGCDELEYSTGFKIPILDKYDGKSYEERSSCLKELLIQKYNEEDSAHRTQDRYDGMLYEFGEIEGSGTVDYFLTNYELMKLAIEKYDGQLTTTSRGSASSYYCSKLLGFTTMDRFEAEVPIYPERFVTKDRILSSHQMPD